MRELICYKTNLKFSLEASKMKFSRIISLAILILIGLLINAHTGENIARCPPEPQRPGRIQACRNGPSH